MKISDKIYKIAVCSLATMLLTASLHSAEGIPMKQTAADFTSVAKTAIPAVVSIRVKESKKGSWGADDDASEGLPGSDFWYKFFGLPDESSSKLREGQGSGFLVSADGLIITNGHVVQDTSEIVVNLHNGQEYLAKVLGQDSNTDIALLKIEGAANLPFLKLGNSSDIEVGQWVAAIGTPMGLEASLTTGVISAKGRNNLALARVEDFIQTDAALYHGNSGGPLLNLSSEVIGINTAIASKMGGYLGIGFAVPSNIAKNVMEQILSKGSVSRGFIGVLLHDANSESPSSPGNKKQEGALIALVTQGSPAEKAGIKQGDIILSYNKLPVISVGSLRSAIAMMAPGSTLELSIIREKQPQTISVTVGEYTAEKPSK